MALTRIYCRENQLSADAAEKLNMPGTAHFEGKQRALVLTHELLLEWGMPATVRTPWRGPDGEPLGVQLRRVGKLAWLKLHVNVYTDHEELQLSIHSVALKATVQDVHAQHAFEYTGLPQNIIDQMPAPSSWASFDQRAYDDAFKCIQLAQGLISKMDPSYEPPETELMMGVVPSPQAQFVKSAVFAVDCLASLATGRVLWDAESAAGHKGLDPSVCGPVYQLFGAHSRLLCPGAKIHGEAADWMRWIVGP